MTEFIKQNSVYKIWYLVCWSVISVSVFSIPIFLVSVFTDLVFGHRFFPTPNGRCRLPYLWPTTNPAKLVKVFMHNALSWQAHRFWSVRGIQRHRPPVGLPQLLMPQQPRTYGTAAAERWAPKLTWKSLPTTLTTYNAEARWPRR
jgi:hypothetical protein